MPISLRVESDYPGTEHIYYAKMLDSGEYGEEVEIPTRAVNINLVAGKPATASIELVLFKEDILIGALEIVRASALVLYCPFCKQRFARVKVRCQDGSMRIASFCDCFPEEGDDDWAYDVQVEE